jgi:hypothetical protein
MIKSSKKVYAVEEDLDFEDSQKASPPISTPTKTRSSRLKPELTPSPNRPRSISVSSFLSQDGSIISSNVLETLINHLTTSLEDMNNKENLKKFEEICSEIVNFSHDLELQRVMKSHGWTGSRFRSINGAFLDAHSLLQGLSNLYLKNKMSNYTAHISNIFGTSHNNEKSADQIFSYCPDLLLTSLKDKSPLTSPASDGVLSFSFRGACMLADISGFSKFSGAMCSKGVSGLDDLREATNGFLGELVKTVYEYQGDGQLSLLHININSVY